MADYGEGELSLSDMLRRGEMGPVAARAQERSALGGAMRNAEVVMMDGVPHIVLRRRELDRPQVGAGEYGLPHLPELRGRQAEVRRSLSPEVDAMMGMTGLDPDANLDPWGKFKLGSTADTLYRVGEAGPRQVQKAEHAIRGAIDEPSVGTIANAGTQTGMALLRPGVALPSLAVQYGDALSKDLGLMDTSAQAQGLTRNQRREMEIERQRREGQADVERRAAETNSKLGREGEDARTKRELAAEAVRKDRAEYDASVQRAEDVKNAELAKHKTFRDTEVGKVWQETGGLAPMILGGVTGLVKRGVDPNVTQGSLLRWGIPAGMAASNVPLGADAFLVPPIENPDRRGWEGYARELPPTHPRKGEFTEYAKTVPRENPAREIASHEFFDPWMAVKRNLFGGVEGALGAELGAGAWSIPARFANAAGSGLRGLAGRPAPAAIPGVVIDDMSAARAASIPSTVAGGSSAGTALESEAAPAQRLLSAPEAPRLAEKVLATDRQLQREALPSPDASPSLLPKWAEREGYKVGIHPHNPNQTQRPDGKWGPNLDGLKRQSKAKPDATQSTPDIKAGKPEQSVNSPEPPIVKEPIQIDDMAPLRYRNGKDRASDAGSLGAFLRSMA